jgi:hypothetical protein
VNGQNNLKNRHQTLTRLPTIAATTYPSESGFSGFSGFLGFSK